MNVEREYYENDDFWSNESLGVHDSGRVKTLIENIPESVQSVLELGCGNGIFVNALEAGPRAFGKIVGVDRSLTALRYVRAPGICASVDRLPLADGTFDCVAALEVLEHLPVRMYEAALEEMCRMSRRYAMVSVPYRQDLKESLVECPSCSGRFNPDYHLRSFDEEIVEALLLPFGFSCRRTVKIGPFLQYRGIATFRGLTRRRVARGNPLPTSIPCPMCGYYLPAAVAPPAESATATSNGSGVKPLLKKFWPQNQSHVWIAGVYERSGAGAD